MSQAYNVVDADGHVLEPINLWDHYIDPKFRDRRPQRFADTDGKERLKIDGKAFGGKKGLGTLGAIGARDGIVLDDNLAYEEGRPGGFDPHKRIARKELGFRAGFIRPNPYNGRMLHDPAYEPFWTAAEELDMAIGLHEGSSLNQPTVGVDRFATRGAQHIISHTMEMMLACLSVVWGGVVERHPKLRVGFLESGGGWVAPWLDRMDRHFDDQGFNDSGLTTRPSELFGRNCWISFEPVEGSLKVLADYIGPHKIMWPTDYPHPDGFFPGAPKMIGKQLAGLSAATRRQVMGGGAMGFYGLN